MNKRLVKFILNGNKIELEVEPELLLVDLLRERLGLTGQKLVEGEGDCGACTVLVDGKECELLPYVGGKGGWSCIVTVEGLGIMTNFIRYRMR